MVRLVEEAFPKVVCPVTPKVPDAFILVKYGDVEAVSVAKFVVVETEIRPLADTTLYELRYVPIGW